MAGEARGGALPAAAPRTRGARGGRAPARGAAGPSLAGPASGAPRQGAPHQKTPPDAAERVAAAERDGSRRGELFEAIRESIGTAGWKHRPHDADLVVRMVTVLLDAGRPMELNEASRRVHERRGAHLSESALYAAKFSGAVRGDMYGVLYLERPIGDGRGTGEEWMYGALERAVELGAARHTDAGMEVAGDATGALTAREMAGAGAVARGASAHGGPPGLPGRLSIRWRSRGGGRKTTWAEATVAARAAGAEVGAAYARIAGERA